MSTARPSYEWEKSQEQSWDNLEEDATGALIAKDAAAQRAKRRRSHQSIAHDNVLRGMIRYMYIIVDMSRFMKVKDMNPTRLFVTFKLVKV
jgi:transcription initiation factor TFIIH subunit 2